jgi:hypothetical protein
LAGIAAGFAACSDECTLRATLRGEAPTVLDRKLAGGRMHPAAWSSMASIAGVHADQGQLTLDDEEVGRPDVLDHVTQPGVAWSPSALPDSSL